MVVDHLRWGLLSTARINRALLEPLATSSRNKLLAVASRSQEKADDFAHKNKITRAYGSYDSLLADPDLDVIYNSLPNHLHAEWTIKAVQAGKNVLCEKPLALNLAEVDAISEAAKNAGKVVAEAFMYRSHPQTLKAREIVAIGRLGKIKFVHGTYTYPGSPANNYRWNPEMGGGGLWDVGCYPLSYTRMLLGMEPLEVFGWQVTGLSGVDEIFGAQLRFPENIIAQFDCSVRIRYHVHMDIVGDKATLIIPNPYNPGLRETIYLAGVGGTKEIVVNGAGSYFGEVEDMADAILLGKPPRVSLSDSRHNTASILALFESARTGKSVSPPS